MNGFCYTVWMLLLVTGATAQVSIDYDHAVDFRSYKTFGFRPGRIVPGPPSVDTDSTLLNLAVRDAVAMRLAEKGLALDARHPDLLVTFVAGAQEKRQIENFVSGPAGTTVRLGNPKGRYYAPSGWWGDSWESWWVNEDEEGSLILDVYDARNGELVWRAYMVLDINTNTDTRRVDRQITKALKKFRPAAS